MESLLLATAIWLVSTAISSTDDEDFGGYEVDHDGFLLVVSLAHGGDGQDLVLGAHDPHRDHSFLEDFLSGRHPNTADRGDDGQSPRDRFHSLVPDTVVAQPERPAVVANRGDEDLPELLLSFWILDLIVAHGPNHTRVIAEPQTERASDPL